MSRAPPIVPGASDQDVYLVLDDFSDRLAWWAWRDAVQTRTDRAQLIQDMFEGQYDTPARIVAFNTAKGWSRDVTEEIAVELAETCGQRDEVPEAVADFIARHAR